MINIEDTKKRFPLQELSDKKAELESQLATAHQNPNLDISALSADLNKTSELLELTSTLLTAVENYTQANDIVKDGTDKEMVEMATLEITELEEKIVELDEKITFMKYEEQFSDPDDNKNVVMEIRGGAGGEEAALFAGDLFRMYKNYANSKGWTLEIVSSNVSENGGYKEVVANIKGSDVFKYLKYESGVHRVQRIPTTESSGRIHTSTASVAILPEAEEIDVKIDPQDLRVETMRASGAGGQCVNKTDSAVRITHNPSGIVVSCQETKHQSQNREKAMQMLRARLYDKIRDEKAKERSDIRSAQVGSNMRAEKIRTYNYPQSRITDHRVKISWHGLENILDGGLDEMVSEINDAMIKQYIEEIENQ